MSDYQQHGRRHGRVVTVGAPGSDPPLGGGRISHGQSYNDGRVIAAGSGDWTAAIGAGDIVTITFSPPFDSPPTVTATINDSALGTDPGPADIRQVAVADDHVDLLTSAPDGTGVGNYGFNFIAIGT